jgi:hypothetical protein
MFTFSDLHPKTANVTILFILHLKNQKVRQLIPRLNFTNDGNM